MSNLDTLHYYMAGSTILKVGGAENFEEKFHNIKSS